MNIEIASLDMRILRFLKLLLANASVTQTALHLGISQPAASRILARVRDLIGDPILIRTQSGYQLTDHALGLREPVEQALLAVADVFAPAFFEPAQTNFQYRIASTDYGVVAVLGPMADKFATIAPGLQLNVSPLVPSSFDELQKGEIDLLLYATLTHGDDLLTQKLYDETYDIIFRHEHPLQEIARQKTILAPEDISSFRLIEFNFPDAVRLTTDTIMRTDKTGSNALFQQPYFSTLPFLVGNGDAVAVIPKRLGNQIRKLTTLGSAPFKSDSGFPYHLVRHERTRHNPAINWFVEQAVQLSFDDH